MRSKINSLSDYKKSLINERLFVYSIRFIILVGFFSLWEFCANYGIIDPFLVSKPTSIYSLFLIYLSSGQLMYHVGLSLIETILGLIIGTLGGIIIAIILYLMPKVYHILDPYLVVVNALPKTALAPILIIWIGTGIKGIVAVSVSLSIVVTILSAHSYFDSVDKNKVKMLRSYGANKFQLLTKLILPSNRSNIISIIKINIGMAWVGVIVGEFLISRGGIGYLVMYGGQVFKLDLVMMGVMILAIIAFLMYQLLNILEKYSRKKDKKRRKR